MPRSVSWTKINETVKMGTNIIKLAEPVDWVADDEIVLSTTNNHPIQTEVLKIASVSSDNMTLTLVNQTRFNHYFYQETLSTGETYEIVARVGLLSRNIRLSGMMSSQTETLNEYNYNFNIIVSSISFFAEPYTMQSKYF